MNRQKSQENPGFSAGRRRPGAPGGPGGRMLRERVKLKDSKGTISRLWRYLEDKRLLLVLVALFSLLSSGITILGIRINGQAVDDFVAAGDLRGLIEVCLFLIAIYLFSTILIFAQSRIMIRISQNTTAHIRQDLYLKQQRLPVSYFDTHASGDLMSRLTNDVDNINMALAQNLTQFFNGIISIGGILLAMVLMSPLLTLVSLVMIPFMMLITFFLSRFTRRIYKRQQQELGELNGFVEETLSGEKAVILFGREEKMKKRFREINSRLMKSASLTLIGTGALGPIMNLINNLIYLVVVAAGGFFAVKGYVSTGIVFSFMLYMRNFARPINELSNMFTTIQGALAGAERVFEVMDEEPEQDEPGAKELTELAGEVTMEHIDFAYAPGNPIIQDASFQARPGSITALVGPTGAGKTTLISLIVRFYDPQKGRILLDGQEEKGFTKDSLRKNIGMVLQDTFLFSESIRDNIRYGRPEASDREVKEAAVLAGAHSFIQRLPQGYDTILEDNGENFSQGQRQLLSIARVMLARPAILILDEATSSVDTATERKIQEAFARLMEGRTSFVIAHRLSTIRSADQILVVNGGRIIERGTHEELLAAEGYYANLYNSQFRSGLVE